MTDEKNNRTLFSLFALRDKKGLVGLVVVAILAFFLGGLFFGGGQPVTDSYDHSKAEKADEPTIWTCSMHPQIKLPKAGKCPICFMDLIPLDTGSDDETGPRQLRLSETAKQLARIETTPAVRAFAERFGCACTEERILLLETQRAHRQTGAAGHDNPNRGFPEH